MVDGRMVDVGGCLDTTTTTTTTTNDERRTTNDERRTTNGERRTANDCGGDDDDDGGGDGDDDGDDDAVETISVQNSAIGSFIVQLLCILIFLYCMVNTASTAWP